MSKKTLFSEKNKTEQHVLGSMLRLVLKKRRKRIYLLTQAENDTYRKRKKPRKQSPTELNW